MKSIDGIEWRVSDAPVPYEEALAFMNDRAAAIRDGSAGECVWLLEHPPLFTAGTSADPVELFNPMDFPVFEAGRGGRYTYHGPGQRVGYVMLDLEKRGKDIRCFVHALEQWMIDALAQFGVNAHRSEGRIGIWVGDGQNEAKIGALGVRVKRWVTLQASPSTLTRTLLISAESCLAESRNLVWRASLRLGNKSPRCVLMPPWRASSIDFSRPWAQAAKSLDGNSRFRLLCARFATRVTARRSQ